MLHKATLISKFEYERHRQESPKPGFLYGAVAVVFQDRKNCRLWPRNVATPGSFQEGAGIVGLRVWGRVIGFAIKAARRAFFFLTMVVLIHVQCPTKIAVTVY